MIGWLLAGVFAALSAYLWIRRSRASGPKSRGPNLPGDGEPSRAEEESYERALQGMSRYLKAAVLEPLEHGLQVGELRSPAEDAVDALRDLSFYANVEPERTTGTEDVVVQIRAVVREYTLTSGTPVQFSEPDRPLRAVLAAERFKDALFLLLENAGRFGRGQAVEVSVQEEGDRLLIRIRDRGPGFTEKALLRAFEPFWTTENDALGLGLSRAQRLLGNQGASLTVGNVPEGGGEAVVSIVRKN